MKVLLTGLFPKWQCHLIAECNFAEKHIAAGDDVSIVNCDASLAACDANPGRSLPACLACVGTRLSAVRLLSAPIRSFPLVDAAATARLRNFKCPRFTSMRELRDFAWCGIPAGRDVISSLVTALGSPSFDPSEHPTLIHLTVRDFLAVHLSALAVIGREKFDLVYLFNGRFAAAKAWLRACEKTKTDYITQERLGMPDRVLTIKNGSPHNTLQYGQMIKDFWRERQSEPEVVREAHDFFTERPQGHLTGWFSFTSSQERGSLPYGWSEDSKNIAIFSSTESEFAGLPEYFVDAPFRDQKRAYLSIAHEVAQKAGDLHFYLRVHPNSTHEKVRWWEDPEFSSLRNFTVIPPHSPVSSYDLLQRCSKVMAFMTTMGVEATYWGKPSIILSNAMYRGTGAAYEPSSLEEVVALLIDPNLSPKPQDAALAYGAYIRRGLRKLPHSEAIDHCKLSFKGQRPNSPEPVLRSLWNWENIVSKAPLPEWVKRLWQKWEWYRLGKVLGLPRAPKIH